MLLVRPEPSPNHAAEYIRRLSNHFSTFVFAHKAELDLQVVKSTLLSLADLSAKRVRVIKRQHTELSPVIGVLKV